MTENRQGQTEKVLLALEWDQIKDMLFWKRYCEALEAEKLGILTRFRDTVLPGDFDTWAQDMWHKHGEIKGIERVQGIPNKLLGI